MPVYKLITEIIFPPISHAQEDGLLAVGGDLTPERVLYGLSLGIFPWFDKDEQIMWWSPDPRFVIFPEKAKISRSLKKSNKKFSHKINHDFKVVLQGCAETREEGTWITQGMMKTYTVLHEYGFAMSFETYFADELVGGLYGVRIGGVFIGESMFSFMSDASKSAYYELVKYCLDENIVLIDCQFHTKHLESLGGEYISRKEYSEYLNKFASIQNIPSIFYSE